jgi:hypothetical protein
MQAGNGSKEIMERFSSLPVFLSRNRRNLPVFLHRAFFDIYHSVMKCGGTSMPYSRSIVLGISLLLVTPSLRISSMRSQIPFSEINYAPPM